MTSPGNLPRRVVITGLGVISPVGNSVEEFWTSLSEGLSGIRPLKQLPPIQDHIAFGGEAEGFTGKIENFGPLPKDRKKSIRKALKMMCRESMMAVAAAQHALVDAGYGEAPMEPQSSGVIFGSDYMLSPPEDFIDGMTKCDALSGKLDYPRWGTEGLGEMNPLWMLKYLPNMPASHVAIFNDLRGPNNSHTLREIAGVMAIREAAQTISRGHADRMIAGGTGTRIHSFKTIHAIQQEQLADANAIPSEASRPFDANRTGMVVGEGAGALVLEELESARDKGATIYGEVLGTGSSTVTDISMVGSPSTALANAARVAMGEADLSPSELGHINAHGLGTTSGDRLEAEALHNVLGVEGKNVPVVAAKSFFGNLGAGSGVVELAASLKAMNEGELFRTLNYETPDPETFSLNVVKGPGIPPGDAFLKLCVTPQSQAVAIVIGKVHSDSLPPS